MTIAKRAFLSPWSYAVCLGLLGLAAHSAERRRREIGVRKAVGATATQIVRLLSAESARIVVLSNVLAWPASYVLMREWLSRFPYRVDVSWEPFALSVVVVLAAAMITVSWRSFRAASVNPVEVLRYE